MILFKKQHFIHSRSPVFILIALLHNPERDCINVMQLHCFTIFYLLYFNQAHLTLYFDIFFQDLIPPSYLDELSLLQDRIAPFSSDVAFDMIERELELPIDAIFSEISPEPVAAASLGQVFGYSCLFVTYYLDSNSY